MASSIRKGRQSRALGNNLVRPRHSCSNASRSETGDSLAGNKMNGESDCGVELFGRFVFAMAFLLVCLPCPAHTCAREAEYGLTTKTRREKSCYCHNYSGG